MCIRDSGDIDSYSLDKRYRHADGHFVWITLTVGLICDPSTLEPLHFVSQIEDVTARRRITERQSAIVAAQLAIADVELSPDKVMEHACDRARELTGAHGAVIQLRQADRMIYSAATDSLRDHLGVSVPVDGSLSGRAVTEDRTMMCDDSATDPRVDADACRRIGVASICLLYTSPSPRDS